MCSDSGVSVLYNSGVTDFCLQHLALVLQFADSPCALAGLPAAHRDHGRLIFVKIRFLVLVARSLCYYGGTEASFVFGKTFHFRFIDPGSSNLLISFQL